MNFTATYRYARISGQKTRLVVDTLRGLQVNDAFTQLRYSRKRAAAMIEKLLKSAVANAGQNPDVDLNRLVISDIRADDGPLAQGRLRYRIASRMGYVPIRKRTCHIRVVLSHPDDDLAATGTGPVIPPPVDVAPPAADKPASRRTSQKKKG
jgi:large subunit ribosomal protein L22